MAPYFFVQSDQKAQLLRNFWLSESQRDSFLFEDNPDRRIYLYKVKHKKKKAVHVYATSVRGMTIKEAEALYRLLWEVETGFGDMVNTLPLEQWHSHNENELLQELYVRLWIMNYAKIQQYLFEKRDKNPLATTYFRSNYKLILDFIIDHWSKFFTRKRKYLQKIKYLIKCSLEKRKRYSRSTKRQIRYQHKNYPAANIIFDKLATPA